MAELLTDLPAPATVSHSDPLPFEMEATAWLADNINAVEVVQAYLSQCDRLGQFTAALGNIMLQRLPGDDEFTARCMSALDGMRDEFKLQVNTALLCWWPGVDLIDNPN